MKKGLLVLTALASLNAMAVELQIKGGYDVFRRQATSRPAEFFSSDEDKNDLDRGFVLNAELLPLDYTTHVELGLGVEYNFSKNTLGYGFEEANENDNNLKRDYHHIPVYGIIKANTIQIGNGDAPLAVVGKLGYAFVKETHTTPEANQINNNKVAGGLYYAVGFNGEYGPFVVEALASRTHLDKGVLSSAAKTYDKTTAEAAARAGVINKVGLTAGLRLGAPRAEVKAIEEKPIVVEKPVVVQPVTPEAPKEIIREVIKEVKVPVEKIVEKEVIKEVIKEVKVPVPVYPTITKVELSADALFKFDKYELKDMLPEGKAQIQDFASKLNSDYLTVERLDLIGHTDRLGTEKYNYALGLKRAKTVKAYLEELGVKVAITTSSKGESEPKQETLSCKGTKSTQELKDCLQPSRRVEINIFGIRVDYEKLSEQVK